MLVMQGFGMMADDGNKQHVHLKPLIPQNRLLQPNPPRNQCSLVFSRGRTLSLDAGGLRLLGELCFRHMRDFDLGLLWFIGI